MPVQALHDLRVVTALRRTEVGNLNFECRQALFDLRHIGAQIIPLGVNPAQEDQRQVFGFAGHTNLYAFRSGPGSSWEELQIKSPTAMSQRLLATGAPAYPVWRPCHATLNRVPGLACAGLN